MPRCCQLIKRWEGFFIFLVISAISTSPISDNLPLAFVADDEQSISYDNLQGPIGIGDEGSSYAASLLLLLNRKKNSLEKKNNFELNSCSNIALRGTPSHQRSTKGIYDKAGMHNGRHFYKKKNVNPTERKFLYWDNDYQCWCVSSALGSKVVNLRVADSAILPTDITRSWESWSGERGKFMFESQIRTYCTSQCSCENGIAESSCIIVGAPKCKSCDVGFRLETLDCVVLKVTLSVLKNDSTLISVNNTEIGKGIGDQTMNFGIRFANVSVKDLHTNIPLFTQITKRLTQQRGVNANVEIGIHPRGNEQNEALISVVIKGLTKKQRSMSKSILIGKDNNGSPFFKSLIAKSSIFEKADMQIVDRPTNPPGYYFDPAEADENPEEDLPHLKQKALGTLSIQAPCLFLTLFYLSLIHVVQI